MNQENKISTHIFIFFVHIFYGYFIKNRVNQLYCRESAGKSFLDIINVLIGFYSKIENIPLLQKLNNQGIL